MRQSGGLSPAGQGSGDFVPSGSCLDFRSETDFILAVARISLYYESKMSPVVETLQILVVDDDLSIVNIIETALEQAGYQVLAAHDGEEACRIVNSRHGMALCPFHEGYHPSLKLDEWYYCFGCHATGNVIDFTARLFGISQR
ncbi:MAG: CHC2 zinc finger domain-containing protein [Faecousia sp.]